MHLERPVFNTVREAVKTTGADVFRCFCTTSLLLPTPLWKLPMPGIKVTIAITEGIPVKDMIEGKGVH
ncbi:MAG: hypothetical protein MZV63_26720 [Marinilabiliales bacterium]|nr:hypothetical protein [Marinilabiliales bacterium]